MDRRPSGPQGHLLGWMTRENIQFFLDVVSAVETSHMWAPRKRFWLGLYEEGLVDEAWVAFSPVAVRTAKRIKASRGNPDTLGFGAQTARGGRAQTSLLILRIGNCLVVEGSHSYKVHVFRSSDPAAPSLFQPRYDCESIRLRAREARTQVHHVGWERRVREMIEAWR